MSHKIVVWAHRGASAEAPENTLAAFLLAERAGAYGIELDVRLTADGIPVVLHDSTLDRTTDATGLLVSHALADLRQVDAGRWFAPRFAGEPVPTLEQVLRRIGGRMHLNLEIKEHAAGMAVKRLLHRYSRCRVLISSFDHTMLAALHRRAPMLPLGFISSDARWYKDIGYAAANGAFSFHPRQDRVTADRVAACHALGLRVYPWVVDGKKRFAELLRAGVDGLFTNHPRRMCRWLEDSGPLDDHPANL